MGCCVVFIFKKILSMNPKDLVQKYKFLKKKMPVSIKTKLPGRCVEVKKQTKDTETDFKPSDASLKTILFLTESQIPCHIPETGIHDDEIWVWPFHEVLQDGLHVLVVAARHKVEPHQVGRGHVLTYLCVVSAIVQLGLHTAFYQGVSQEGQLSLCDRFWIVVNRHVSTTKEIARFSYDHLSIQVYSNTSFKRILTQIQQHKF